MNNPFRYFNSSPEVIRLVVMMYARYPLSLRNVEDLLAERGIDISHETVRFWWNRFGPMFAAEIRKKRVAHMRGFVHWRWHLDEVAAQGRRSAQQSRREFASTVPAPRTGDAAVSKSEDAAEVQLSSCPGAQPIQSGAPSRHKASLQAETLRRLGRVACSRVIDRRSRDGGRGACRQASVTLTLLDG
jgi:hypothetical protein